MLKGRALKRGDRIGIVSPAFAPGEKLYVEAGIHYLQEAGFSINYQAFSGHGYFAGSDMERLANLLDMFADPEIDAIIALRGGYGSMRLLDYIDYEVIRENPKLFIGFSDITALHLAIGKYAGLVTFHGPMVMSHFGRGINEYSEDGFWSMLAGDRDLIVNPEDVPHMVIRPGRAQGRLVGGNLSVISSTLGTPFEIDTEGGILILEDINEEPYAIDRMLTHLRLAGKFNEVLGIVFAECVNCLPKDQERSLFLREVLTDIFLDIPVPSFYGLAVGHGSNMATWPYNVMAELDSVQGSVRLLEKPVL